MSENKFENKSENTSKNKVENKVENTSENKVQNKSENKVENILEIDNDNYECMKCKYKTNLKVNMRKHLNKLVKCKKTIETISYTDEQIYDLSLTRVLLRDIKDSELFICEYCKNKYCSEYTLKRHINKFCKKKEEIEKLTNT